VYLPAICFFVAAFLLISVGARAVSIIPSNNQGVLEDETTKTKLHDANLRMCQAREAGIKTRSEHLVQLSQTMIENFDKTVQNVQTYYVTVLIPADKTVPNYDSLTSDIKTRKNAVQEALAKAKTEFSNFSCESDGPKQILSKFRVNMQLVKELLGAYRTSIKNLIVAVHSVSQGKSEQSNACPVACQRSCGSVAACISACYAKCQANQR